MCIYIYMYSADCINYVCMYACGYMPQPLYGLLQAI